jgi:hypothetical protein
MRVNDARSYTNVLRAWLDADALNWERLFEYVCHKAISPHFGFSKLIFELVDGPIYPDTAPGRMFPDDHALVIIEDSCRSDDAFIQAEWRHRGAPVIPNRWLSESRHVG